MMLVQVHCCCDAHLVGWLPLLGLPEIGRSYKFTLPPVATWADGEIVVAAGTQVLTFECAWLGEGGAKFPALKSRDYPLEQLRRIPNFVEASRRS